MKIYEKILNENLTEILAHNNLENKKIILFGKNYPSILIKRFLENYGISVYAFIDNNPNSIGENVDGINVYKPEDLLAVYDDEVFIFIASAHYKEMAEQLQEMGYKVHQHIIQAIDFEFASKEVRNSLKDRHILSLQEIQQESLEMLRYIKEVCDANHITYFMCAGTLLGAVRHKGFIPWDDDIDIAMPYPDYISLKEKILQEGRYNFRDLDNCELFLYGYAKMESKKIMGEAFGFSDSLDQALSIDIFPIYSLPDDEKEREFAIAENIRLKKCIRYKYNHMVGEEKLYNLKKELVKLWTDIGYHRTKQVMKTCVGAAGYGKEEFVSYEAYGKMIPMEFCGELFSAPIGYDEILHTFYGDYMQLPPIEKQKTHHKCLYYYKQD